MVVGLERWYRETGDWYMDAKERRRNEKLGYFIWNNNWAESGNLEIELKGRGNRILGPSGNVTVLPLPARGGSR